MRPYAAWAIFCAAFATLAQMAAGRGPGGKPPGTDPPDGGDAFPFDPTPPVLTVKDVWNYAVTGCPDSDIADRFLVDQGRIAREFADTLRSARALRRYSIRRHQTMIAFGGKSSTTMLQWIGRNELGQSLNPATPGMPEPVVEDEDPAGGDAAETT